MRVRACLPAGARFICSFFFPSGSERKELCVWEREEKKGLHEGLQCAHSAHTIYPSRPYCACVSVCVRVVCVCVCVCVFFFSSDASRKKKGAVKRTGRAPPS